MFNLRKLTAFLRPASPAAPYDRAVRLLEIGAFAEAERELNALLEAQCSDRERAMGLNKRGVARVQQGRRAEAFGDFSAALDSRPNFAPAIVNLGNLLLEDGQLDEAILQYERALRCDSLYAVAHMNLSAAYKRAGRHADAVREFRLASRVEGRLFKKKKRLG